MRVGAGLGGTGHEPKDAPHMWTVRGQARHGP